MAFAQVFIFCLGLTMLVKQGEAQPALSATSLSVAENTAAGVLGTLASTGSPASVTLGSLPMDGMLTAAMSGTDVQYTLASGFSLNYDTGTTSFTFTTILVDSTPATATVTTTLTITDVTDEFSDSVIYTCVSGFTALSAGTTLSTQVISSGVTSAYTITAQSPSLSLASVASSTGVVSVASGKTIDPRYMRALTLTLQSVSTSSTPVTSTTSLVIYFGTCSSTSGAAAIVASVTLLLAALVAMLQ